MFEQKIIVILINPWWIWNSFQTWMAMALLLQKTNQFLLLHHSNQERKLWLLFIWSSLRLLLMERLGDASFVDRPILLQLPQVHYLSHPIGCLYECMHLFHCCYIDSVSVAVGHQHRHPTWHWHVDTSNLMIIIWLKCLYLMLQNCL